MKNEQRRHKKDQIQHMDYGKQQENASEKNSPLYRETSFCCTINISFNNHLVFYISVFKN